MTLLTYVLRQLFTLIISRRPRGRARSGTKTARLAELANFRPKNTPHIVLKLKRPPKKEFISKSYNAGGEYKGGLEPRVLEN